MSTQEQARSGYSLAQQMEALRAYAGREGYEVLEEVSDPGQSGASSERPGTDRVRDLVTAGGVSVVLAQDRDRFAREPAYLYLLRREFEEHGAKVRALNDRGDESPEGELTDGSLDQLAKFERAKIRERSRRGKARKVREGKVIATHAPRYGFRLNAEKDGYEVDEEKMAVVRRVFRMVGVEAMPLRAIKQAFEDEGIPTPGGAKRWDRTFFRACILDDVYRPHTFEEASAVLPADVAALLDPEKRYGIWYWGRRTASTRQISELADDGTRRYRKAYRSRVNPKAECAAAPVPDSRIPREWVDAARERIGNNRVPSRAGDRVWALSGGIGRCEECGRSMRSVRKTKATKKGGRYAYHYYRCPGFNDHGVRGCGRSKNVKAEEAEAAVWEFVRGFLLGPGRLEAGLDRMIEQERRGVRGDPEREAKAWLEKLAETDRKREGYLDLAATGRMGYAELDAKLGELGKTRETALAEIEALEGRKEMRGQMERDRDALLDRYARMMPESLDSLDATERRKVYEMLRLRATLSADGATEVEMVLGRPPGGDTPEFSAKRGVITVCPHGRPIVKRVGLADLLREFGRA